MMSHRAQHLFHRLWGKAKDHENYDKQEWMDLQEMLDGYRTQQRPIAVPVEQLGAGQWSADGRRYGGDF